MEKQKLKLKHAEGHGSVSLAAIGSKFSSLPSCFWICYA